jgi:UDP-N-acetylglucosamine 2-epimerase (non-hydrolysing)
MRIHNVIIVLGSGREAVTMAPLMLAMRNQPDLRPVIVITGGHLDACRCVLSRLDINPDFTVNVGEKYQLDDLLYEEPDLVLAAAGTDTTVATTLDAFFHRVPVMHVGDSGGRGRTDQCPGELDRMLAVRLCAMHLVSTPQRALSLQGEGVSPESIVCTGDRAIDPLLTVLTTPITHSVRMLVELDRRGPAARRALEAIRYFLGIGPRPAGILAATAAAGFTATQLVGEPG